MNKYLSSADIEKKRDKLSEMVFNSQGKPIHGRYVHRLMLVDREIAKRVDFAIGFMKSLK